VCGYHEKAVGFAGPADGLHDLPALWYVELFQVNERDPGTRLVVDTSEVRAVSHRSDVAQRHLPCLCNQIA
jgi:hypothetical protein